MTASPIKITRRTIMFRVLVLFLAGAVVGPLGDFCHVLSDTDGYPVYSWIVPVLGLPLWVPPLFGLAAVGIGLSHPWADRFLGPKQPRPGLTNTFLITSALIALLVVWAASGFLPLETGGAKDLFMIAAALGMWFAYDRTWQGALLGLLTGVFYYRPQASNLWGVPSWLPVLYFCASIAVGNFGRFIAPAKAPASDLSA
jgi:hypothetical protein